MSSQPNQPAPTNGAPAKPAVVLASSLPNPAATGEPAASDPMRLGEVMFRSGLFPDLHSAAQAVVKILAGRELGIGPFAALSDIHIIEGKAVVGARILGGLVRASKRYDYKVVEWTNDRVAIDFYRDGQRLEPTITFDQEDAQRAGLTNPTRNGRPSNHMRYPRHMKFARAMSTGVGLHCPDLTAGIPVYTTGELDADPRPEGQDATGNDHTASENSEGATVTDINTASSKPDTEISVPQLLSDAARFGYHPPTVVALARFFYGADNLQRLAQQQRVGLARRIAAAGQGGVAETTLCELADKGQNQPDRDEAIRAADDWLTRRPAA